MLAVFLRDNKRNKHKCNLIEFIQDKICTYSAQENRPAEQIKGMSIILRDIVKLDDEMFNNK